MKETHFASFYFRVCDLSHEIREDKNLAKISTYTGSLKSLAAHIFLNYL